MVLLLMPVRAVAMEQLQLVSVAQQVVPTEEEMVLAAVAAEVEAVAGMVEEVVAGH
jgi:hypothetical protein